jgi:outer membrane protein insertion porin family/translocation and assembly module TamA
VQKRHPHALACLARSCARAAVVGALLLLAGCHEEEGIEVADLRIEGAEAIPASALRQAISTRESSALPWGQKRYFNRAAFEADLKRIHAYYADHGYPSARVSTFDVKLDESQKKARITIVVEEGAPVVVDEVRWWGFEALTPRQSARVTRSFPLTKGSVLDRSTARAGSLEAARVLHDSGYPYGSVELLESEGPTPGSVVLTLAADVGPRARIGTIEVNGNRSVSDEVILRTLSFKPEDVFRLSSLQASQRRLYDLDLFQFANVEPRLPETPAADVPVRVTVAEGKHRRLRYSFGYGSEERARAQARWQHVNFFGGARTAAIEGKWSSLERGVRAEITQPYVFGPDFSAGGSAQWWYTDEPAYQLDSRGVRASLTRQMGRARFGRGRSAATTITASVVHQFDDYVVSEEALNDPTFRDELIALGLDPTTGEGSGTLVAWMIDARRSTTTNLLDARRGYVASLHIEQAGQWLPGAFNYFEVSAEGRHYTNLGRFGVWANRARVGSIRAPDGDLPGNVPFFKRYFLGGSNSLRGWGRYEVSPLSGSGLPIGGHSLLEMSSELRAQVIGNFGIVLFVDAGNVWSGSWDQDLSDLYFDAGPGLRYSTPIGPVRVDLGYQLNTIPGLLVSGEPQPRRWRLHFSIGHAF